MSRTDSVKVNKFYMSPIKPENDVIRIEGIFVIKSPETLNSKIKSLMEKQYLDKSRKYYKDYRAFKPKWFTLTVALLSDPVLYARDDFYTCSGEWLYLYERIDIELFKLKFKKWCRENTDADFYEYIKDDIEGITISQENIEMSGNPHNLQKHENELMYKLLPAYLAYKISGEMDIQVPSSKKGAVSYRFYKVQNEDKSAELAAVPFRKYVDRDGKEFYWTHAVDLRVVSIPGESIPYLIIKLRTARFAYKKPYASNKRLKALIYKNIGKGFEIYELGLKMDQAKWKWKYNIADGINDNLIEKIFDWQDTIVAEPNKFMSNDDLGAGIIYGSHIKGKGHKIRTGTTEKDREYISEGILKAIRNHLNNTNIEVPEFITLDNIAKEIDTKAKTQKAEFRFEQIPAELVITAFYRNDAWLEYLKDALVELFDLKIFKHDKYGIFKAKAAHFDKSSSTLFVTHKEDKKEVTKKIILNPVKMQNSNGEFIISESIDCYTSFLNYLDTYVTEGSDIRASLFELEDEEYFDHDEWIDPKSTIRNVFAVKNTLTQFISLEEGEYINRQEKSENELKEYKANMHKYINGIKDLFRQLGILGKSVPQMDQEPILIGLWYMSKLKHSFDFSSSCEEIPYKILIPILTIIEDNIIKIAVFSESVYKDHRRMGDNFEVKWLPYKDGLVKIANMASIFDELNGDYCEKLKQQFIVNAIRSVKESNPERQLILFSNAQNVRTHLKDLSNTRIGSGKLNIGIEKNSDSIFDDVVNIRILTEADEVPAWVNLEDDYSLSLHTLKKGVFRLNNRVYYSVQSKSDAHKNNLVIKEDKPNETNNRQAAIEIAVYNCNEDDVPPYVDLTDKLRSASSPIQFSTALNLPIPVHMAKKAEEYLVAYYDDYFLKQHLIKEKAKEVAKANNIR
ncbi:pPIWI_RE module domain-containing protein [Ruminiclostridium cellulolyticum]|uniref:DUF3893 domain-containing protein n=1 Tax=Ruminiclostridium cellulolyticum (strain ATCC 35319 / DSM 5812 / JCM 6584 / H10) TaxID=394503 RepID=B8I7F6_RUMCH|nr:DUF3962 domain-containing protein [Ruminiclostridium cellulolyticum]ACL77027.1 hypothetical protein Ccel_2716 [Ruminiclostridium cellulolyticum H10]